MKTQRMRGSVIGNRGAGVVINFNRHTAGVIGEKVRERRVFAAARDVKARVADVPSGHRAGIGNVQGEVFEFHKIKNALRQESVEAPNREVEPRGESNPAEVRRPKQRGHAVEADET